MQRELEYDRDNVLLNAADEQGALTVEAVELLKNDGYRKSNAAEIVEQTDKDFAVGLQYHPEAAIDKNLDCQTNAADYMSYEDAIEVFAYLVNLVK